MNDSQRNVVPPSWGISLTEGDYTALEASWITPELADQAFLRRVGSQEGREILGQKGSRDCSGIVIPYYWPGAPYHFSYRVRRDKPDWAVGKDGKPKPERKYLAAPGTRNRLYIPPGVTPEQLADVSIPVVIGEGEKKGLALQRLALYQVKAPRFIPIAISGVWNWRGKIGRSTGPRGEPVDLTGPIADLDRIEWNRRKVLIVFDVNVLTNENVEWARKGITRELASRAADVQLISLPADCGVNGIDDLLALWGPERVLSLFQSPEPAPEIDQELSQAQLLIALAEEAKLFHTPESEPYARVPVADHHETWTLRGRGFRRWLTKKFYEQCAKPPRAQALQDAIGVLEARAQFDSPEVPLFVRLAEYGDRIYVDLTDAKWRAVEIGPNGWHVVADPPIHFRRPKGMQALPEPAPGGSIEQLRSFINVGDNHNWVLCASWLFAACRTRGPFPILIVQGEQGSAKSTMVKLLRRVIDPSSALVRTLPRDDRDLLIAAANSWVIAYDNLSGIPQGLSDSLCRLATGGGFSTRELYTDAEEVFFDATRPVVLNGIDHIAERADLADRALILHLPRIESKDRKDEASLYADFQAQLPQILGALYSAVSDALKRLPDTFLDTKPRMADFALWATAGEEALGFKRGAFMSAYSGNRAEAVQETLEADPVGAAILAMMAQFRDSEQPEHWKGTCKELSASLQQFAEDGVKSSREWPKSPRALSSRLRRLTAFLSESGIEVTFYPKGTKGQRSLAIRGTVPQSTAANASTATAGPHLSVDERLTSERAGGGPVVFAAVESPARREPPLEQANVIALDSVEKCTWVAKVAEEAVVCEQNPHIERTQGNSDRIDFCSRCGPTKWEWIDAAWVCAVCGQPARSEHRKDSQAGRERFEI